MADRRCPYSMDIKGRLLDQAVLLFNCVPFIKWGLLLKEKIGSQRESEFFPLRGPVPYGMEYHFTT